MDVKISSEIALNYNHKKNLTSFLMPFSIQNGDKEPGKTPKY